MRRAPRVVIVDGNNVMGAKPDGWWRDRPAAVRRLVTRLQCYATKVDDDITLVLDVPQADLTEGVHDGVRVVYATRKGRDAADDRIRELLDGQPPTFVVTSDRELAKSTSEKGVEVVGAGAFLRRLDEAGC